MIMVLLLGLRAREIANMEQEVKELIPTPLKPIKQVELWKKWGPLLSEEARKVMCLKPTDHGVE